MRFAIGVLVVSVLWAQGGPDVPAGWKATSPLNEARHSACSVRLDDGRTLVAGGTGAGGSALASV